MRGKTSHWGWMRADSMLRNAVTHFTSPNKGPVRMETPRWVPQCWHALHAVGRQADPGRMNEWVKESRTSHYRGLLGASEEYGLEGAMHVWAQNCCFMVRATLDWSRSWHTHTLTELQHQNIVPIWMHQDPMINGCFPKPVQLKCVTAPRHREAVLDYRCPAVSPSARQGPWDWGRWTEERTCKVWGKPDGKHQVSNPTALNTNEQPQLLTGPTRPPRYSQPL